MEGREIMRTTRRDFLATGAAVAGSIVLSPRLPASDSATKAASGAALAVDVTTKSWPLFRGDSQAQGVAKSQLPDKPQLLWSIKVEGGAFESTPAIADGVVYVADMDGKLSALNLTDGKEIWHHKIDGGYIASPSVRGELLYIGDIDGKFYAFDRKSGQPRWTHQADAQIDSGANFWRENVLFGSQDANLYCLHAATGKEVWKFAIADQIRCMPTVVGDRSFVAGCDSQFHIIDLTQGNEVGAVPIEAPTGVTPAVLGDLVFFGTEAGTLLGVNWKEAKIVWKVEDKVSAQPLRGSPAVQEGILVVGTRSRSVQAHNPATGDELWTVATKQRVDSSPVIVGPRVFVGAADGRLYALDLKTGKELWQYQATGGFTGSPAVADGKLVIATDRGVVLCLGAK
jgi:outer membrane protein assembly factor BamB